MFTDENLVRLTDPNEPDARLICFAHAGAGPAAFKVWLDQVDSRIELYAIRLPGHENLFKQEPIKRIEPISQEIASMLDELDGDLPTCLFGYCAGAFLAFELAKRISTSAMSPLLLAVCSQIAPHLNEESYFHLLQPAEFKDFVRSSGATDRQLIEHEEIWELIEPALRADYEMSGTYSTGTEPKVGCDIIAFHGSQDHEMSADDIGAWAQVTTGKLIMHRISGSHFLMESSAGSILDELQTHLLGLL